MLFETTSTGLTVTVIKISDVRVGDRLYVTRSGVDNDVRTVTEVIRVHRKPTLYRFDRGPDLNERELQRRPRGCRTLYGDGTVLLLDPDVDVGDLPDEFDLLPKLDQWIELGGAIRIEHTSYQTSLSGQMLAAMYDLDDISDQYHCYAINPRSLLIEQLRDGDFDEGDPRPQILIRSGLFSIKLMAADLVREALGLERPGYWRRRQGQLNEAAGELGVQFADASEVVVIRTAKVQ